MWLSRVCFLLFMVVSCNAECYIHKPSAENMKGCIDPEGQTHDFNSEWEKDCYKCVCDQSGIQCCNKIPTAIDHPDDCQVLVDKTTCSFKLVLVSDNSKPCVLA